MKIKEWVKENWIFLGIILFAIGVRIYYFILTYNQPLWYDESVYLLMSQDFRGLIDYSFPAVRPVLFSLIMVPFLGMGELVPRLFMLLISIFSVIGIYYLGKETCNKTAGLIGAFLFSTFYIGLFYTYRLLVDLPSMAFFIFSALFFYKYAREKKHEFLYLVSLLVGVGTLFKLSTAFILLPFLVYLVFTEKIGFIKRKEIWISAGIFIMILLPYVLWGYDEFGGFVLSQASEHVAPQGYIVNLFSNLKTYFGLFDAAVSTQFLILFLISLILMYRLLLYFGEMREGNPEVKGEFYLILLLILPLLLISAMINHSEDRYIITIFPVMFTIIGIGVAKIYDLAIMKTNKIFVIGAIIIMLVSVAIPQIQYSDRLIKSKISSYADVKQAGLWLKNNSQPGDIIATKSQPQIRYYSERKTIGLPATEEEFESSLNSNVSFYMISIFEAHQQWQYDYPEKKNLTLLQAHITFEDKYVLLIYKLK